MLTKIDICSMALLKLGEAPIQSLTDDSAAARLARTLYEPIADTLLAMHPWHFASRTIELVRNTDGEFRLPSDCLRVIKCDGQISGDKIISSQDKISITALMRIPAEMFPTYFASLAATKLAMEFCIPLTGEQAVFRTMAALYESELQTAKFIDSSACKPDAISDFSLISARF